MRSRNFNPKLLYFFLYLQIRKYKREGFFITEESNIKIDIVIPTVSKDIPLLNSHIESLRTYVRHPINKIFIVSRNTDEMQNFCKENNVVFVDETSILGYGPSEIEYTVKNINRSGWIFQQLIKLSGHHFVEMDNYLIVDSDTLLIKDHTFMINDRYIFLENSTWHRPYLKSFKKIFGFKAPNPLAYTSHMMIFNVHKLKEMKKEIETYHTGRKWDQVYLSTISSKIASCVSDYDSYANWMKIRYPKDVYNQPLYNTSLSRSSLLPIKDLSERYGRKYKSLSFHHYFK